MENETNNQIDELRVNQVIAYLSQMDGVDVVDVPREPYKNELEMIPSAGYEQRDFGVKTIRAIKTISPFRKLQIVIGGVNMVDGNLVFETAKQRVQIDDIVIDRNQWSRVDIRRVFNGQMNLSVEVSAFNDLFNLLAR